MTNKEKLANLFRIDIKNISDIDLSEDLFIHEYYLSIIDMKYMPKLKKLGVIAIYPYDDAQVPGDQHPSIAFRFKK